MKSDHPIDRACEALQDHVGKRGLHRIEMTVWSDGRVTFIEYNARGWTDRSVRADLADGSTDQMPSAALADLVNGTTPEAGEVDGG